MIAEDSHSVLNGSIDINITQDLDGERPFSQSAFMKASATFPSLQSFSAKLP